MKSSISQSKVYFLSGAFCDLVWSDPEDLMTDWAVSPRGAGWLFGNKVTNEFMQKNNLKLICRAHQLVHEGKVWMKYTAILVLISSTSVEQCLYWSSTLRYRIQVRFRRTVGDCVECTQLLLPVWQCRLYPGDTRLLNQDPQDLRSRAWLWEGDASPGNHPILFVALQKTNLSNNWHAFVTPHSPEAENIRGFPVGCTVGFTPNQILAK